MGDEVRPTEESSGTPIRCEFDRYGRIIVRDPDLAARLWERSRKGHALEVVLSTNPPTPVPQPINRVTSCPNGPKLICPFHIVVRAELAFDEAWRVEQNPAEAGGGGDVR